MVWQEINKPWEEEDRVEKADASQRAGPRGSEWAPKTPGSPCKSLESGWVSGLRGLYLLSSELLLAALAGVDSRKFFFPAVFLSGVAGER